ncbi:MAG: heme lyase CcmF/NrfE family subunit [Chloroflexi bacterium]|nr:heme lyase CcmF/NrfE family subunit [Chloroflexota bacterium]
MAEIGYVAILLSLVTSVYIVFAAAFGAKREYPELVASARNGMLASFALLTIASLALVYSFVSHDFGVKYVAQYSSSDMPLAYVLAAFYAGQAGSLLFWGWLLSLFGAVVVLQEHKSDKPLIPYVFVVMAITQAFFSLLMMAVSNPFERLTVAPPDGGGLNPLLENIGMIVHPPLILAGYVAYTVPFAFAVAALVTRRLGDEWIGRVRRWSLLAWFLLGAGNLLGAQWAYVELGWGGYWAWDPVENAGLLPWLLGTAFLHSAMIQRRRGMFRVWNMVLVILTFNLCIFGTFLTRSGILTSVHTFGDTGLGPFFVAFLGMGILIPFGFLVDRLEDLKSDEELDSFIARETTFVVNNLILVGSAFAVFWGTMLPFFSETLRGVKITVGPDFFNRVNGPILLLLILLMGVCPLIGWRKASLNNVLHHFLAPFVVAVVLAVALIIIGVREVFAVAALSLCGFVAFTILLEWGRGVRARHRSKGENFVTAFASLVWGNRPRYGGYVVHLSIVLMVVGIVGSSFFKLEQESTLAPGQSMSIGNYTLKFEGLSEQPAPSREVVAASLSAYSGTRYLGQLNTEKQFHRSFQQPVTEVGIYTTPLEDLYIILGGWTQDGKATFKAFVNPLVVWIWIGGILLLIGSAVAFWPEKEREMAPAVAPEVTTARRKAVGKGLAR